MAVNRTQNPTRSIQTSSVIVQTSRDRTPKQENVLSERSGHETSSYSAIQLVPTQLNPRVVP